MTPDRFDWHATDADLAGYLAGGVVPVVAASVETHLLACADCRARMGAIAGRSERDRAWRRLAEVIDRPSPTLVERLTGGHFLVRSAIATPAMVRSALIAVALIGLVPLAAAATAGEAGLLALLVLAPLAPVAAVAVAYREAADPAGEISLATPAWGLRLVAMRALVVSLIGLGLALAVLWLVEARGDGVPMGTAVAWFLPGLAMAGLVLLAGTTRLDPLHVAVAVSLGWGSWVISTATMRRNLRPEAFLDLIASPATQSAALAVAVAALLFTLLRRDAVAYRRTT